MDLIWQNISRLPGDENQKAIRRAFVSERYAGELKAWSRRRDLYRNIFAAITLGTAALGVVSSGLVAATVHGRSDATDVVLILIGVFVAIFAATNQFLSPREVAAEYKRDEFALRILGWRYLQRLEQGDDPMVAYASFQRDVTSVLDTEHMGSLGPMSTAGRRHVHGGD